MTMIYSEKIQSTMQPDSRKKVAFVTRKVVLRRHSSFLCSFLLYSSFHFLVSLFTLLGGFLIYLYYRTSWPNKKKKKKWKKRDIVVDVLLWLQLTNIVTSFSLDFSFFKWWMKWCTCLKWIWIYVLITELDPVLNFMKKKQNCKAF
jgi:amino acid transporter